MCRFLSFHRDLSNGLSSIKSKCILSVLGNLSTKKTQILTLERDSSEKEQSHSQRCQTKSLDECKLSQAVPCHRYIGGEHYEEPSEEGLGNNNNSCESDQNRVPVNSSSEIDWSFGTLMLNTTHLLTSSSGIQLKFIA